jgi:hypothetical protein
VLVPVDSKQLLWLLHGDKEEEDEDNPETLGDNPVVVCANRPLGDACCASPGRAVPSVTAETARVFCDLGHTALWLTRTVMCPGQRCWRK